jgi:hypothetical protein
VASRRQRRYALGEITKPLCVKCFSVPGITDLPDGTTLDVDGTNGTVTIG